jgi:asparagine synthase (glutamine-hydrolysing)
MCGIGGVLFHARVLPNKEQLSAMSDAMRYRGPDDTGYFFGVHIGLVHRRLSIRDLSPAGHCPMASSDNLVQVVFNGEIYNWRELRLELEALNCHFISHSDTEVIVQGYQIWGEELISRLRGMFAVAIWDEWKKSLFIARDRAGEKPLFYQNTEFGLAFASSLVALEPSNQKLEINPIAIASHLCHNFIPARHTAWKGINVLPPGHLLKIRPGELPQVHRYWDFPRVGPSTKTMACCTLEIETALNDSVSRCLDADVPVGVFLSGGVDSSLIAALAVRHKPDIKAFSLGFEESEFSELPFARRVAEHLGIEHYTLEIGVDDVIDCLPHLVSQYGQPFGDASAVPSYLVSRLAREHVKVCLSGDGGDELFGGYWRMQSGVYAARYGSVLPKWIREYVVPPLIKNMGGFGRRFLAMNELSLSKPGMGYTNSSSWLSNLTEVAGHELKDLSITELFSLRVGNAGQRPEASTIQKILYDDFQVQLPDAYLTKVDVASMAASLEVRAPFLDHTLMELAWEMPDNTKLNWGRRKYLLKRLAASHVPRDIIYRPKMGFAMPLAEWFSGRLGDFAGSMFQKSHAVEEGYIKENSFQKALNRHKLMGGEETRLWSLMWLELWFRQQLK